MPSLPNYPLNRHLTTCELRRRTLSVPECTCQPTEEGETKRYWGTLVVQVRFDARSDEQAKTRLHQILQELRHDNISDGSVSDLGICVYDEEQDAWERIPS